MRSFAGYLVTEETVGKGYLDDFGWAHSPVLLAQNQLRDSEEFTHISDAFTFKPNRRHASSGSSPTLDAHV